MSASQADAKNEQEADKLTATFVEQLEVDQEVAQILVREGFSSIEELVYVPVKEMLEIDEFDEDLVEELRNRARDALLIKAIATEEKLESAEPTAELRELEGMDDETAYRLARAGIRTVEDLAELAVDELLEIGGVDEEKAAQLIMRARLPWFAEG
jgi:N utilization substance protein A